MTWEAARAKVAVLQAQADVDISAGGKKTLRNYSIVERIKDGTQLMQTERYF